MKRKWFLGSLSALACLTLAVGFAGCGGNDGNSDDEAGSSEIIGGGDNGSDNNGNEGGSSNSGGNSSNTGNEGDEAQEQPSEGLKFTINTDGASYSVRGIGTCQDTEIVIPDEYAGLPVSAIGNEAFAGCTILTEIVIPESISSINAGAFAGCTSLTEIVIPDSVTSISEAAFLSCTSLTNVLIGNGVTSIGYRAFRDCTSLTSVVIGDSVTSIGQWAFRGCSSLMSITIPDNVTSIGEYAFSNTGYYNTESNWEDDILYIGKYLIKAKSTFTGEYEIKDGTLCIADYSFYDCTSLTSIEIPDSVTSIGERAFYDCTSLTNVVIGDSVTSIASGAFYDCTNLTEIQYNATKCEDLSNGNYVFSYAGQNGEGIKVTIGATVKKIPARLFSPYNYNSDGSPKIINVEFEKGSVCESIGIYALAYCTDLTSISIPDSVTSIGENAFYHCDSLTIVYYKGTTEEWESISIGSSNAPLEDATVYYYSETEPTETGNYCGYWYYNENGEIVVW